MTETQIVNRGGYFEEIDLAKGFAILLAVIGHSFPDAEIGWSIVGNPSFASFSMHWIYSFHMAVFFLFAGFLFIPRLHKTSLKISAWKRFKRLMVPYLFYSLIYVGLKTVGIAVANHPLSDNVLLQIVTGDSPAGGCWFLWVLFIMSMLCLCCRKLGVYGLLVLSVLMYTIFQFDSSWMIGRFVRVFQDTIWFCLGGVVAQYYAPLKNMVQKPIVGVCAFILLTALQSAPGIWYFSLIKTISGIIMTVCLASNILGRLNGSVLHKSLLLMGKYCMNIYLLSMLVVIPLRIVYINMGVSDYIPYYPWILFVTLMGIILPILASKYIVRNNKLLNLLFLGN